RLACASELVEADEAGLGDSFQGYTQKPTSVDRRRSGPTGVLVTLRASGSGKLQAIDVQLLAVSEVSTLDNTSCSRVEARAPGEPGDEIDPDLLPRHCAEHVAVGAHTGTFW